MTDKCKLLHLKSREINIIKRSKYKENPGCLNKVRRQIRTMEIKIKEGEN